MDTDGAIMGIFLTLVLIFGAGFAVGGCVVHERWEANANRTGHGEYNQKDGKWQWKEPRTPAPYAAEREQFIPLGQETDHPLGRWQEIPD